MDLDDDFLSIENSDLPSVTPPQKPDSKAAIKREDYTAEKRADILDKNIEKGLDIIKETQDYKAEAGRENRSIDRLILIIFGIALLSALGFSYYLLAVDKINSVSTILYPIITATLGFFSGYFAGTGRSRSSSKD